MSGDATINTTGSLTLKSVGTAGNYTKITTDAQGRVISGGSLIASDIPNLDWAIINSGKPTTLSGYGITNGVANNGNVPSMQSGLDASKPTAGTLGNLYIATDSQKIYRDNGTSWVAITSGTGTGTVISINTGVGLVGGPITSSGTISLDTTTVAAGNYGSNISVATFAVDAYGRLTAAGNSAIPLATTSATGLLTSTDWNTFNNKLGAVTGSTLTSGYFWLGDNSNVATPITMSGDATLSSSGSFTLINSGVAVGTYSKVSVDAKGRVTSGGTVNLATDVTGILPASMGGSQWTTGGTVASGTMLYYNDGYVGIGTTSPRSSLDIGLKTDALIVPAGSVAQRPTGYAGSIRYAKDTDLLEFYNISAGTWQTLAVGGGAGSYLLSSGGAISGSITVGSGITVNSGGIDTNYTGIINTGSIAGVGPTISGTGALAISAGGTDQNLTLTASGNGKVTSSNIMTLTSGSASTNTTSGALVVNGGVGISGSLNVGSDAIINTITVGRGGSNVFNNTTVGSGALVANTTGIKNTAMGFAAMNLSTTGSMNSGFGYKALEKNTSGAYNTSMGWNALSGNTVGDMNTALGVVSLISNTTGDNNTAIGNSALWSNTTGNYNSALGSYALYGNTLGLYNTAIGASAGRDLNDTTGTLGNNTFIGYNTGRGVTTGYNNTILGANVTGLTANLNNNVIIADGAGNRRINIDSSGNVGIGTSSPNEKLEVNGKLRLDGATSGYVGFTSPATVGTSLIWTLPNGDGTNGQALITNGAGTLSWYTPLAAGSVMITANNGLTGNGTPGGTITTSGTIGLDNTTVAAGNYGSNISVATFAVDAYGRITDAGNSAIPLATTSTTGLLTSTDWNTFNNKLGAVSGSTLTSGNFWLGDNSNVATPIIMSGDATLSNSGTLTLASSGVTAGTYSKVTVDAKGRVTSGGTIDLATDVTGILPASMGGSLWTNGGTVGSGTMLYYNSGYVGIGTTSPVGPLDVNGKGFFNFASATLATAYPVVNHTSGVAYSGGANALSTAGSIDSPGAFHGALYNVKSTNPSSFALVGIGRADSGWYGAFGSAPVTNGAWLPGVGFGGYTASLATSAQIGAAINGVVDGAVSSGTLPTSIVFRTSLTNESGLIERMRISPSGNVGIGTTSAADPLHISKSGASARNRLRLEVTGNLSNQDSLVTFSDRDEGSGVHWSIGAHDANDEFRISNNEDLATTTRFLIDATGNIGIGTISPTEKLEVNGKLKLDGSTSGYVGFTSPATVGTSLIWTLPNGDGSNGQALITNGAGTLTWYTPLAADSVTIKAGNGLTGNGTPGGTITTSGTIGLETTTVAAGNYGSNISIATFAVDAYGRLTAAGNSAIPLATTSATGLLTSTDWNTFNNKLGAVSGSTLTSGNFWLGDNSNVATSTQMSGDATLSNSGTLTLANSGVAVGTYSKVIVDAKGRVTSGGTINLATDVTGTLPPDMGGSQWTTGGTVASGTMLYYNAGNVGIGTTNPGAPLEILDNSGYGIKMKRSNATAATFGMWINSSGVLNIADWTSGNGLYVKSNGNVGIGSTNAGANLEIATNNNTMTDISNPLNYHLYLRNYDSVNGNAAGMAFSDSSSATNVGAAIIFKRTATNSKGELQFYTKQNTSAGSAPSQVMVLTDSGKVGIGTSSPNEKLEVNGKLRLDDSSSGYVGFTAPPTVNTSVIWTLPASDGTAGQVLSTLGSSGTLAWTTVSAGNVGTVTSITVGNGLTVNGVAGGTITSAGTISIGTTTVAAGNYGSNISIATFAVDAYGRITAAGDSAIPFATTSATGLLTSTDWNTFNNKLGAVSGSTLTSGYFWLGNGSNVATAATLSGDATLSNTGALTLASSGVAAGTYSKVTVDAKGRVTSGGTINLATDVTGTLPTSLGGSQWTTGGTVASGTMLYYNSGLVGIGTSSPDATLSVKSSSQNAVVNIYGISQSTDAGVIQVSSTGNLTNSSNRSLALQPNGGKVGIGTSSPSYSLEVNGHINASNGNSFKTNGWSSLNRTGTTLEVNATSQGTSEIVFFTNGDFTTPKVKMAASGNVGIGTTSPGYLLSVAGTIQSSVGGFRFPDGSVQISSATGGATQWTTSGTNIYYNTGNVGIGTNNPGQALDVVGSIKSSTQFLASTGSAAAPSIAFSGEPNTGFYLQSGGIIRISSSGVNKGYMDSNMINYPAFWSNTLGSATSPILGYSGSGNTGAFFPTSTSFGLTTSGTERFRIDSNGNVGIATTNPGRLLDVSWKSSSGYTSSSSSSASPVVNSAMPVIRVNGTMGSDSHGSYLELLTSNTAGNTQNAYLAAISNTGAGVFTPAIVLGQQTGATAFVERMRIDASGNVGIGTTSPAYMLSVAGTIQSSVGGFRFPDGTIQTTAATGSGTASQWTTNSTNIYYNTGNVGIGTASPLGKLDVVSNSTSRYVTLATTASNGAQSIFNASNNGGTTPILLQNIDNSAGLAHFLSIQAQMSYTSGNLTPVNSGELRFFKEQEWTSTAATQNSGLLFSTTQAGTQSEKMRITSSGNFGIGTTNVLAKLHVNGGMIVDSITDNSAGNAFYITTATTTAGPGSVYFNDSEAKPMMEIAPIGPRTNYSWMRMDAGTDTIRPHIGVHSNATNPGLSIGPQSTESLVINSSGNVGIGTTSPGYKLEVNGQIAGTSAYLNLSDSRLKTNVQELPNSLETVRQLRGVAFDWRTEEYPDMKFDRTHDVGVIAQEVEAILPEAVSTNPQTGIKAVAYSKLIAPIINAIKELYENFLSTKAEQDQAILKLQADNEKLKRENEELKARMDRIEKKMMENK